MGKLKSNWFGFIPRIILVLVAVISLPLCFALAQVTEDPDEAFDQYKDIQKQIEARENLLKDREGARNSALKELVDIDKDINYLNSRIDNIQNDLRIKDAQMMELERQLGRAAEDLAGAQEKLDVRLVEWYKAGSQQDVNFLLRASSLNDFVCRFFFTERILEQDKGIIDSIKSQKSELFDARDDLNLEIEEVNVLKADLSGYRSDYRNLYSGKKGIFDRINNDVEQIEAAINELESESQDIASYLRGMEGTAFYPVAGKFDGTLSKPIAANAGSGFGMRNHPILKRRKMHDGLDFPASRGTQIRAAGGGQVVFCGTKSGYGKTIIINHGNGLATLYAHCSKLLASDGEFVLEGQVIAKVGSTGFSTGPHLHFEVRKKGTPKNPMNYIR